MIISGPCPTCASPLEFKPNGRYGRVVASCTSCGDDYGLSPSGVGRLGTTLPGGAAQTTELSP